MEIYRPFWLPPVQLYHIQNDKPPSFTRPLMEIHLLSDITKQMVSKNVLINSWFQDKYKMLISHNTGQWN